MSVDPVTVMLEEYKALRAEILDRSRSQQTLLQIHTTVLATLLGLALTKTGGPWVVLIIPIEASVFGYWYWDHGWAIFDIARHIRRIEAGVNELTSSRSLSWETRNQSFQREEPTRFRQRHETFTNLLSLTFQWPALVSLTVGAALILATSVDLLTDEDYYRDIFKTSAPFTGPQLAVAAVVWGFGLWLHVRYRGKAKLPVPTPETQESPSTQVTPPTAERHS